MFAFQTLVLVEQTAWIYAEQEAIRALATRTEAPMAPEGKGTTK